MNLKFTTIWGTAIILTMSCIEQVSNAAFAENQPQNNNQITLIQSEIAKWKNSIQKFSLFMQMYGVSPAIPQELHGVIDSTQLEKLVHVVTESSTPRRIKPPVLPVTTSTTMRSYFHSLLPLPPSPAIAFILPPTYQASDSRSLIIVLGQTTGYLLIGNPPRGAMMMWQFSYSKIPSINTLSEFNQLPFLNRAHTAFRQEGDKQAQWRVQFSFVDRLVQTPNPKASFLKPSEPKTIQKHQIKLHIGFTQKKPD